MNRKRLTIFQWLRTAIIWLASIAAFLTVAWFVPSISNASINMLFRLRGELPAPEDIVIVAIDDQSLQRIGKYPWPRQITAECLNKISQGEPQAVGIDVIYAEESDPKNDNSLADAIRKNGHVVLPVQLFEDVSKTAPGQTEIAWLTPLPELNQAAAGRGHAHAAPDVDGTLRSVQLSKSDDKGNRFWAFGLEVLRVAEKINPDDFEEKPDTLRFGTYNIKLFPDDTGKDESPGVSVIRPNEMLINYTGTTRSFKYYSFADVLDGKIAPETFRGKIVLMGATSPTLGDAQVTPFMHYASTDEKEGGQAMPGVEVHANIINTIKSRLWLGFLSQYLEFSLALLVILGVTCAVKLLDGWQQVLVLVIILTAIIGGSLTAFNNYSLILPLPELATAFLTAVPLLLIDRSLAASRDLDIKLNLLSEVQNDLLPDSNKELIKSGVLGIVPRNLEWKLRAVDEITARLLSRMGFINRVLTGMNEGVMVADTNNRIVFINHSFTQMFRVESPDIIGQNVTSFLLERNIFSEIELQRTINQVLAGEDFEKEFETSVSDKRHYFLRFSPVTAGDDGELKSFPLGTGKLLPTAIIGFLILLSDVTKQRELDRLKAETFQLVSHELRAPLTSIQGLSDVLRKFAIPADESREMLATIHSEAIRLNGLINRFLDIKRLESGVQDLQTSRFDINKLIESSILAAGTAAAEKKIKIQFIENQPSLFWQADSQLVEQAIGNLLSNAIKYSPPETIVKIETVKIEAGLQIIVKDEGYGIPANSLTRIFERFYRLERDSASKTIGTGLGLSFVREVAEKHGGHVIVESQEGIGSTFIIFLPV